MSGRFSLMTYYMGWVLKMDERPISGRRFHGDRAGLTRGKKKNPREISRESILSRLKFPSLKSL